MGCDGGTIPTRDELVKTKKRPEQKDKTAELAAKWKHCAISLEPLQKPILACELGRLYNKESVLEFLLDKSKFEFADQFDHLRGLRDLKELKLSKNPAFKGNIAEKGDAYIDTQTSEYICPVVGIELSGKYKFCYIWSCGCVLSERALKEIKSDVCHKCNAPYDKDDVIILNGTEEEVETMRENMKERRQKAKAAKQAKKAGKHKAPAETETSTQAASTNKKIKLDDQKAGTSKIEPKSKQTNGKLDLKPKAANGKVEEKTAKVKSIQDDPNASATYKSLFTTSSKAKNQQKAHWVTFNPMYY